MFDTHIMFIDVYQILNVGALFADGLLFGLAIKKALTSAILLVVAIVLAGYVGLSLPFLNISDASSHLFAILMSQYHHLGPLITALPVLFIIGLGLGLWRG